MTQDTRRIVTLLPSNTLIGDTCRACHKVFKEGDTAVLIPLGPGDNLEERMRMLKGLVYTAVCAAVHKNCAHQDVEEK